MSSLKQHWELTLAAKMRFRKTHVFHLNEAEQGQLTPSDYFGEREAGTYPVPEIIPPPGIPHDLLSRGIDVGE